MRFRNKMFLLLLVAITTTVLAGQAQATTYHQTKHFADGSTAVFTLSDGSGPVADGAGIDLGDLGPNAPESAQSFVFKSDKVTKKSASLLAAASSAPAGTVTRMGHVEFTNIYHVRMFQYAMSVTWDYSGHIVRRIYNQKAVNVDNFYGWVFDGTTSLNHTAAGGANFSAFAQGNYHSCILWVCTSKTPWMRLQGNGNGLQTDFWWGGV